MLWSGAHDEFGASNEAYDYLIPAFVEYLMTVQPPYPYPPNPEVYIAVFSLVRHWVMIAVTVVDFQWDFMQT